MSTAHDCADPPGTGKIDFGGRRFRVSFLPKARRKPMPLKTTLTALALALMPVLGAAEGCSDRSHQAQSCAPGTVWDSESRSCTEQANS